MVSCLERMPGNITALSTNVVEICRTCIGEHGVGIGKRKFMEREYNQRYPLIKEIKDLADHKG
jgi:D-lactate dehydrogenase (cytochrome)